MTGKRFDAWREMDKLLAKPAAEREPWEADAVMLRESGMMPARALLTASIAHRPEHGGYLACREVIENARVASA